MNQRLLPNGPGRVPVQLRALLIAAIGFGAACTSIVPDIVDEPPEPVVVEPVPEPEPAPVVEAVPEPPVEELVPDIEPLRRILVLVSNDAASYTAVASSLDRTLTGLYEIEHVNYAALDDSAKDRLHDSDAKAVVAIGLDAARFAATELRLPTIVCQIYELEPLLAVRDTVFGVAALPPPALQLEAWKELAPEATSVGLFVTEDEQDVVAAARQAAAAVGLDIHVEFAASDRELLYRFKRLAPELDGLWLVPDNDILSPPVLRDVFSYALMHGVHTVVFSPSLLSWGALLSVGGGAENIASTVTGVLDALAAGNVDELARVTNLTAVDVHVNDEVASSLGIRDTSRLRARSEVVLK